MAVLVTGGAGYIGSHMALELADNGETVVVLDNLSTGIHRLVPQGVLFVEGDAGDEALVGRLLGEKGVDAILHFAGSIVVPDSVADPLGYYLNNTVKSRSLLAAAVAHGVKHFIFSSTAAVYGQPEEVPIAEDTPTRPINPYGASKLVIEWMLRDLAAAGAGLRSVALRYFNVAGADPKGRTGQATKAATHLIKVACEAVVGKRAFIEVYGSDYPTADGTCVRDYIHVADLADAHVAALDYLRDGGANAVFNCGYGTGYSVREVVEVVKRFGRLEVRQAPRRPGDPPALIADPARLRSQTGWRPRHADLGVIVESALAWERTL
jgi:UDP-glucose 4-epimerase